jgi:acetyl-CoA decarbonylase/synthase complex subunit gamma
MALTGMQIYKNLPRTNCKDCGLPTCMAFAMQVAAKQRALGDCPHISEEGQATLSEASAPPMKLVKIGAGEAAFEFGQETVMFRHEEKFHRPCGIAALLPASLSEDELTSAIETINRRVFMRVGKELRIALAALQISGCKDPAARAALASGKSERPLILISGDVEEMRAACLAVKSARPLIYRAEGANVAGMTALAAETGLPLAVAGRDLSDLADNARRAREGGVEEIVLSFDGPDPGETIRRLTTARRAALKKQFRSLGFPAMVDARADDPELECLLASMYAAKYAGIVMIRGTEPWELLPIMTTVQDVYTDPQVPNTVEARLYEIGNPGPDAPVLFTTNFSLTYFSVEGEVERSKVPAYIAVVDTEGLGVLNAYAGDKISAEKVVKTLADQKVLERVSHRRLIIPGLLPIFRAEIEDTSDWKEVIIGPETAREIPGFLSKNWK